MTANSLTDEFPLCKAICCSDSRYSVLQENRNRHRECAAGAFGQGSCTFSKLASCSGNFSTAEDEHIVIKGNGAMDIRRSLEKVLHL